MEREIRRECKLKSNIARLGTIKTDFLTIHGQGTFFKEVLCIQMDKLPMEKD